MRPNMLFCCTIPRMAEIFANFHPSDAFASMVLCGGPVSVSICLSVCLSIVPKRLNIVSRKQRRTIAQGLRFCDAKDFDEIPIGSP